MGSANPSSRGIKRHSPLTITAQHGYIHVVRSLRDDRRTDVNAKEITGRSALSFAAGNGQRDVVQALLEHEECHSNEVDNSNSTPLFQAVCGDHTDVIVDLLENRSVDVNHIDKTGRSAISWAAGDGFLTSLKKFWSAICKQMLTSRIIRVDLRCYGQQRTVTPESLATFCAITLQTDSAKTLINGMPSL